MYAFVVGFNEWVLKVLRGRPGMAPHQVEDASGWAHDGQIIRPLKTPQALTAWAPRIAS